MKKLFLIVFFMAFVSVNAYSQSDDADNDVYNMVDQSAKFQDGYNSIIKFVKENIKFPAEAQENNVHGKLMVSVVVEKDGALSDIKIKKGYNTLKMHSILLLISHRDAKTSSH